MWFFVLVLIRYNAIKHRRCLRRIAALEAELFPVFEVKTLPLNMTKDEFVSSKMTAVSSEPRSAAQDTNMALLLRSLDLKAEMDEIGMEIDKVRRSQTQLSEMFFGAATAIDGAITRVVTPESMRVMRYAREGMEEREAELIERYKEAQNAARLTYLGWNSFLEPSAVITYDPSWNSRRSVRARALRK